MLRITLGQALRRAAGRTLPQGWLYLADVAPLTPETFCVVLDDEDKDMDSDGKPIEAIRTSFPFEGLNTQLMEDTAEAARRFDDTPSDELLIESFEYYRRFDAFLPKPGAPAPPPWAETQLKLDRDFYELLGSERPDQPCRRDGCTRGAISQSVLCRSHHFESIKGRACPFAE
jgi:hypothetical protein